MTNEIVRAITGDGLVKAAAVTGRDIVEQARNIHKLLPIGRIKISASIQTPVTTRNIRSRSLSL